MHKIVENQEEITSKIIKVLSDNNLSCYEAQELLKYVVMQEIAKQSKLISE